MAVFTQQTAMMLRLSSWLMSSRRGQIHRLVQWWFSKNSKIFTDHNVFYEQAKYWFTYLVYSVDLSWIKCNHKCVPSALWRREMERDFLLIDRNLYTHAFQCAGVSIRGAPSTTKTSLWVKQLIFVTKHTIYWIKTKVISVYKVVNKYDHWHKEAIIGWAWRTCG